MSVGRPRRVTKEGPTDDLKSDEVIALYCVEYSGDTMENLGIAVLALISALPDDRLWSKPNIFRAEDGCVVYAEGIKRKVFESSEAG